MLSDSGTSPSRSIASRIHWRFLLARSSRWAAMPRRNSSPRPARWVALGAVLGNSVRRGRPGRARRGLEDRLDLCPSTAGPSGWTDRPDTRAARPLIVWAITSTGLARVDPGRPQRLDHRRHVVAADVAEGAPDLVVGQGVEHGLGLGARAEPRARGSRPRRRPYMSIWYSKSDKAPSNSSQDGVALRPRGRAPRRKRPWRTWITTPAVGGGGALDAIAVGAVQRALVGDARAVEVLAVVVDDPGDVAQLALRRRPAGTRAASPRGTPSRRSGTRSARRPAPSSRGRRRSGTPAPGTPTPPGGCRPSPRAGSGTSPGRCARGSSGRRRDARRPRTAAGSEHGGLGLVLGEPRVVLAPQEPHQVVQRVVHRRRVRLAAHVVLRLAHDQVQGREDRHRAGAGGRVAADLGVARALVLPRVGEVDHRHRLREGARGDAVEYREVVLGRLVGGRRLGGLLSLVQRSFRLHQLRQRLAGRRGRRLAGGGPLGQGRVARRLGSCLPTHGRLEALRASVGVRPGPKRRRMGRPRGAARAGNRGR